MGELEERTLRLHSGKRRAREWESERGRMGNGRARGKDSSISLREKESERMGEQEEKTLKNY